MLGYQPCPLWPKGEIAFRMIEMPMGIDSKINAVTTNFLDGGFDIGDQLRELVINNEHTIVSHADSNIATQALPESSLRATIYPRTASIGANPQ